MNLSDQAELMARGLDIPPASYAGREADAIVAMAILDGYRQLIRADQEQVLYVIRDEMRFGETNPAFFQGCQTAVVMMVANPVWAPGSMTNGELEDEITRWRQTRNALTWLGFGTGGSAARSLGKRLLTQPGKTISSLKKPSPLVGAFLLGTAAQILAHSALAELQPEATRRGALGRMTPLHAQEFGP